MLSYRHGFHAGNHADVLKHVILCLILRLLKAKGKPLTHIDTHAGAGLYRLDSAWSRQTGEYLNGVAKAAGSAALRELVPEYFRAVMNANDGENGLSFYPGSPLFAADLLGEGDSAHFLELHPADFESLKYNLRHCAFCHAHLRDAREGLPALVPPEIRRGLVFVDPPYELEGEYAGTAHLVKTAARKYPESVYAVWYPLLGRAEDQSWTLIRGLAKLNVKRTLRAELAVRERDAPPGMYGSGVIILNAPYGLAEKLREVLPVLRETLALDGSAKFRLELLTFDG